MHSRLAALLGALAALLAAVACGADPAGGAPRAAAPALRVTEVAGGLEHVWDVGFLPDGRLLVTERPGRISVLSGGGAGATLTPVAADLGDVYVRGEGGLMGLAVLPGTDRFVTCQTHAEGGRPVDVRLVSWELDGTTARRVADPLVAGLPINPSGRHSGCRPTLAPDGALIVGTGDTARGALSQDRTSLGGKTLRIDPATGGPAPGNPFAGSANPAERLVNTYGHRNVQGVAVRPGTGEIYTAEHGPKTDDEINRLRSGANYGWDPSQGGTVGGYDESVPMTDLTRFPDAVPAVWRSGAPPEAISGATFLSGPRWGPLDGTLAVAALRGEKLLLMTLGPDGAVASVAVPPALDGTFGRLRTARSGPDGALYVTTSNGAADDKLLRIDPL